VGLFFDASQVSAHLFDATGHITLGVESGTGASVILPGTTVWGSHASVCQGYHATWANGILGFQLVQELIRVEFLQHLDFGEFSSVIHFRWYFYEVVFLESVESHGFQDLNGSRR